MDLGIDISIVKKREKDNGQHDTHCCCSVGTSASCTERARSVTFSQAHITRMSRIKFVRRNPPILLSESLYPTSDIDSKID